MKRGQQRVKVFGAQGWQVIMSAKAVQLRDLPECTLLRAQTCLPR